MSRFTLIVLETSLLLYNVSTTLTLSNVSSTSTTLTLNNKGQNYFNFRLVEAWVDHDVDVVDDDEKKVLSKFSKKRWKRIANDSRREEVKHTLSLSYTRTQARHWEKHREEKNHVASVKEWERNREIEFPPRVFCAPSPKISAQTRWSGCGLPGPVLTLALTLSLPGKR